MNELNENDEVNEEGMINLWKNESRVACNVGVPKYIKQILTVLKGEVHINAIMIGDLRYTTFKNG